MAQSILSFYLIGLLFSAGERRVFWTKHASFKNHLYKKKKKGNEEGLHTTHTPWTHIRPKLSLGKPTTDWLCLLQFYVSCMRDCTRALEHVCTCMGVCVTCVHVCVRARARDRPVNFFHSSTHLCYPPPPTKPDPIGHGTERLRLPAVRSQWIYRLRLFHESIYWYFSFDRLNDWSFWPLTAVCNSTNPTARVCSR